MQVAPIRSPGDMLRAQSRLMALGGSAPGSAGEIESAALRDAIEHYRCVTEASAPLLRASPALRPTHA